MSTKTQVLALLAKAPGHYFSGQEIADSLGVTRASVWKAIKLLRQEGYDIDAATNRGYAVGTGTDVLTSEAVSGLIPDLPYKIEVYESLASTNTTTRERASLGEGEGLVIIAGEQTAGRGRNGRDFYSPAGTGLYLSVLLRPKFDAKKAQLITSLAAVASARAAEAVSGQSIKIKWVNDLFLDGRKVCGILTEASVSMESGGLDYAVLGLGFNLAPPESGWGELEGIAGSLFDKKPSGAVRAQLAAAFLREFHALYAAFDSESFLDEYRSRQLVLGKYVEVIAPGREPKRALALDIDDDCRLLVRYEDGTENLLLGGEVRILPV